MSERHVVPRNVCAIIPRPCFEHEARMKPERRRNVADLHPALGPPAHELDFFGVEVRAARHRRRAVVFLDALS